MRKGVIQVTFTGTNGYYFYFADVDDRNIVPGGSVIVKNNEGGRVATVSVVDFQGQHNATNWIVGVVARQDSYEQCYNRLQEITQIKGNLDAQAKRIPREKLWEMAAMLFPEADELFERLAVLEAEDKGDHPQIAEAAE